MAAKIAARMNRMAPSGIRKVNEKVLAMERAGEKVLHFEIGRPDFDNPEYIKRAANQALAEGKVHYTSNFDLMEPRQAIADKLKQENNVDYKASEVLVTVGLSKAVFAYLLEEAQIALVPGNVFGPGGEGYLRMSFANSYENVVEGCEQLRRAVKELRK